MPLPGDSERMRRSVIGKSCFSCIELNLEVAAPVVEGLPTIRPKPLRGLPQARLRMPGQPRRSASLTLEVDLRCAHKKHFFQTF